MCEIAEESGTFGKHFGAKARMTFKETLHGDTSCVWLDLRRDAVRLTIP